MAFESFLPAVLSFYLTGPRLYQRFVHSTHGLVAKEYEPNNLEYYCNIYFTCLKLAVSVVRSFYPIGLFYLLRRADDPVRLLRSTWMPVTHVVLATVVMSMMRGVGRWVNKDYTDFSSKILRLRNCDEREKEELRKIILTYYDFEMGHGFPARHVGPLFRMKPLVVVHPRSDSVLWNIQRLVYHLASYIIYPLAIRLTYIGSTSIISISMREVLIAGRQRLITQYDAQRELLRISDHESIDTVFIDRRVNQQPEGSKLLICCEGNAGFYEIGSLNVALLTKYSLLGWNHPGFGESQGTISVVNEQFAIQAVMSYATDILNFREEDVYVYGWSIGGYSAALIAASYPHIGGLIMDAVFDNALPLATKTLPVLAPFIEYTMNSYINLDNVPLLQKYSGPIRFVRRLGDEIINLTPGKVSGNLINNLVIETLAYRYPEIFDDEPRRSVRYFLSIDCSLKKGDFFRSVIPERFMVPSELRTYLKLHPHFPCNFGSDLTMEMKQALALFLCDEYLVDFNSGHCDVLHISLINNLPIAI